MNPIRDTVVRIEGREHQFHHLREECLWCGMTREQIEEYGERICPRREPRYSETTP